MRAVAAVVDPERSREAADEVVVELVLWPAGLGSDEVGVAKTVKTVGDRSDLAIKGRRRAIYLLTPAGLLRYRRSASSCAGRAVLTDAGHFAVFDVNFGVYAIAVKIGAAPRPDLGIAAGPALYGVP